MGNRTRSSAIHGRHPFLFFLLILIFVSIACISDDFACWLNPDNCEPAMQPAQNPQGGPMVDFYAGNGSADTIYEYSNVPSIKTNTCHDEISDAWVKIYHTQEVPANVEISQKLTTDQFYFTAEIHSALKNPWIDKKCVYAESKDDYTLYQINGIYDKVNFEFTPIYYNYEACSNAAKLISEGSSNVILTYDCVRGPTSVRFTFDLPLQTH